MRTGRRLPLLLALAGRQLPRVPSRRRLRLLLLRWRRVLLLLLLLRWQRILLLQRRRVLLRLPPSLLLLLHLLALLGRGAALHDLQRLPIALLPVAGQCRLVALLLHAQQQWGEGAEEVEVPDHEGHHEINQAGPRILLCWERYKD